MCEPSSTAARGENVLMKKASALTCPALLLAALPALFHAGTGFLLEVLAAPWYTHDMAQVAW